MLKLNLLEELEIHYQNLESYEKKLKLVNGHEDYLVLKHKHNNLKEQLNELIEKNSQINNYIRKASRALEDNRYKLKDTADNLYGGKVQDIKQLSALEREKLNLEKIIEESENEILEKMEQNEEMSKDIVIIEDALKNIALDLKKEKAYILKLKDELEKLIQDENITIKEISKVLDSQVLDKYLQIRQKKNSGIGIVINEICNGCHTHVPKTIIDKLKLGKAINTCETCGRILVLRENKPEYNQ